MSPKRDKTVLQIVEKALIENEKLNLDRDLLRGYIRKSNPILFDNKPSNLKKLDRYLRKAFKTKKNKPSVQKTQEQIENQKLIDFMLSVNPKMKKNPVLQDVLGILGYSVDFQKKGELKDEKPR